MSHTHSLDYAREIAKRNRARFKPQPQHIHNGPSIQFVTQCNRSLMSYDTLITTVCSESREFTAIATQDFDYFDWDGILFDWLVNKFVVTQWKNYETDYVDTFIEIETPSGARQGIDIEGILATLVLEVKRHNREVTTVPHNRLDSTPLWYGNETSKEHDLQVVAAYKGKSNITVPLGGNFPTTLIKQPITFEKVVVNRVGEDGKVTSVVQQNLCWTGEDGKKRTLDYRLNKVYDRFSHNPKDKKYLADREVILQRYETEFNAPLKAKLKKKAERKLPTTPSGALITFNL